LQQLQWQLTPKCYQKVFFNFHKLTVQFLQICLHETQNWVARQKIRLYDKKFGCLTQIEGLQLWSHNTNSVTRHKIRVSCKQTLRQNSVPKLAKPDLNWVT
jgi:hypothetical protein